jgi:hypothetical protein
MHCLCTTKKKEIVDVVTVSVDSVDSCTSYVLLKEKHGQLVL